MASEQHGAVAQKPAEPLVSVVIPCRNEAENLPFVLGAIPDWPYEVIVVDSASTDETVKVAREVMPNVRIVSADGPGKGRALAAGFSAARGDITLALDADGSNRPSEMAEMVAALKQGFDLVKGSRYLPGGGSDDSTRLRGLGNSAIVFAFNRLYRTRYTDICYGYLAFWTKHRNVVMPNCAGFEVEALLNAQAARAGLRVLELPSYEDSRLHGTSNLKPFSDGMRIIRAVVGARLLPPAST